MRTFEDFRIGDTSTYGPATVTRDEILAFARQFDPQPFHLSDEAGAATHFGGLVASGWHTAAVGHRLLVDGLLRETTSLGSPGVDELRWLKPVRPDDALTLTVTVLDTRPSRSKPDRGAITWRSELSNQRGEVVMTMRAVGLFARRP